jgi:hypothetical protein
MQPREGTAKQPGRDAHHHPWQNYGDQEMTPVDFDPVPPETEVRPMTPAEQQAFADQYQRDAIAGANSLQADQND